MDKPKLLLIHGTQATDTPKERARAKLRAIKRAVPTPQCPRCGGTLCITAHSGKQRYKYCMKCFGNGEHILMQ